AKEFSHRQLVSDLVDFAGEQAGATATISLYGISKIGRSNKTKITLRYDPAGPAATITSQPAALTNATGASFTFTGSQQTVSFECDLNSGGASPCTSPYTAAGPLSDGTHTFRVRGIAGDGARSAFTTYSWTVDTVPPVLSLDSSPSANVNTASVAFTFSATDASSFAFQCKVDAGAYSNCSSPRNESVAAGSHTFYVIASDAAGNQSAAQTANWLYDSTAPTMSYSVNPGSPTNAAGITVSGACADAGGSGIPVNGVRLCIKSGGACSYPADFAVTSACTLGSYSFNATPAEGIYDIKIAVVDGAGNYIIDGQAAVDYEVDRTAPAALVSNEPTGTNGIGTLAVTVSGTGVTHYRHKVGLNADCNDANGYTAERLVSNAISDTLSVDGSYRLCVVGRDAAGNYQGFGSATSRTWTRDSSVPNATISGHPTTNFTNIAGFTLNVGGTGVVEYRYKFGLNADCGVATGYSSVIAESTDTAIVMDSQGLYRLCVVGKNAANTWQPYASATSDDWTRDVSAPGAFTISGVRTLGPEDGVSDGWLTNLLNRMAVWTAAPGAYDYEATIRDSGDTVNVCGPSVTTGTNYPFGCAVSEGTDYIVRVVARDEAGNQTTTADLQFTVDTTPPATTCSVPDDTVSFAQISPSVSCTDTSGCALTECELDGSGTWGSCSNIAVSEGAHTIATRSTDNAGLIATGGTCNFTIDRTPPAVTITAGPTGNTTSTSATFSFTTVDGGTGVDTIECSLDGTTWNSCVSPESYTGLSVGAKTFWVRAIDFSGNTGSDSQSWTIDPPANNPPVAQDDIFIADWNQQSAIAVLTIGTPDSDADGDPLTVSITSPPSSGSASVNPVSGVVTYDPNANFLGIDTLTYQISDGTATDTATVTIKVKAPHTWDGGGVDANWSTPANWHSNTVPTAASNVYFDETCDSNCNATIDTNAVANNITLDSGYAGTLTQASGATLTVTSGGWTQMGGTFNGSDAPIYLEHVGPATTGLILGGGTFNAPNAVLQIAGDLQVANPGTFNPNTGTVELDYGGAAASILINVTGSSLYNLSLNSVSRKTAISGTLSVTNDLSVGQFHAGLDGGIIELGGDLTFSNGTGTLACTTCPLSTIHLNGLAQTVTGLNALVTGANSSHNVLPNLILESSISTTLAGPLAISGSITDVTGTTAVTSPTVVLNPDTDVSYTLPNTISFNTVRITASTANTNITITGALYAAADLQIYHAAGGTTIDGGAIHVGSNLIVTDAKAGGTAEIILDGSAAQSISYIAGIIPGTALTIDKPSGTANLTSNISLNATGQDLVIANGDFNFAGYDAVINDTLAMPGTGDTLWLNGDETVTFGALSLGTNIVHYNGSGNYASLPLGNNYGQTLLYFTTGTFAHTGNLGARSVFIGGGATLYSNNNDVEVTETFSNTSGAANYITGTQIVPAGANTVILSGSGVRILGSNNFHHLTVNVPNGSASFESGTLQTIAGMLTLTGASGSPLLLNRYGGSGADQWRIDPQGGRNVSYVEVENSLNTNATTIVAGSSSVDRGNNNGWNFGGNNNPTIVTTEFRVMMDSTQASNVLDPAGDDTDPDGDAITLASFSYSGSGSMSMSSGTLTYAPPTGFYGTDTFSYTISDGNGGSATGAATIYVVHPQAWTGAVNADWSTPGNWGAGAVPTNAQTAIFDITCTANCNPQVAGTVEVGGVEINQDFAGTIQLDPGAT
ncbi:MAG TPA: Ig-like domain-containing protein, partial [Bdellovibrionales bacterium]|nr:Ig-like domain-containing protein [Bdellovibrionales bacterium]